MRVLPSTIVIASVGAAGVASAGALLVVYGFSLGDWWPWCLVAVIGGVAVLSGAIARELILRASPDQFRKMMSGTFDAGSSAGFHVSSGDHHGGDGSGGHGDGGGGH